MVGQYLGGATPLRPGHLSMSIGGGLVAPPLGDRANGNGPPSIDSGFAIVPMLTRLICHADHVVVHLLRPLDVGHSRWETRWFVADTAVKGVDFDVDALTAVWRATNRQDISLCESARAGVRSPPLRPRPAAPGARTGGRRRPGRVSTAHGSALTAALRRPARRHQRLATVGTVSSQRVPAGVVHQLPADLRTALIANSTALDAWKSITPLARNEFICWVEDAKQEATRQRRIRRTQEELEEGQRRPCCWPGCTHRERTGR